MLFYLLRYTRDVGAGFVKWIQNVFNIFFRGAKNAAKRVAIISGLLAVTLWISVLLYASFYHIYVPSASVVRPAHFKFRVCPNGIGMCSFPIANVTLSAENRAEILGRGQQYRVILVINLPDSPSNRDVGMFMVISRMYDRYGHIAQESSRAVSLHYQSDLLKTIQTVALSPLYITGVTEQTQTLSVELFDEYWDDFYHPAVGVLLEIQSRQVILYSAQIQFHACYAGLRYYLFFYPVSSAFFGILFNFSWLFLAFALSWYNLGLELFEMPSRKKIQSSKRSHEEPTIRYGLQPHAEEEERLLPRDLSEPTQEPEMIPGLRPRDEHEEEESEEEREPRSYIQPFTMNIAGRRTETGGGVLDTGSSSEDLDKSTDESPLRHRATAKADAINS